MTTCNWCGNGVSNHNMIKAGWGLKLRFYCSNRCKTYGEEAREKAENSNNNKAGGFFGNLFNNNDAEEGPSVADMEKDKFDF